MKILKLIFLTGLLVLLFTTSVVIAQTREGILVAVVHDPNGAILANTQITAENQETGDVRRDGMTKAR